MTSKTGSEKAIQLLFGYLIWEKPAVKQGFPGGSAIKNPPANAGGSSSTPRSRRSPGERNGNPLQYSCLENPLDRGAGQATGHRVRKSQTRLSNYTTAVKILWDHMLEKWEVGVLVENPSQLRSRLTSRAYREAPADTRPVLHDWSPSQHDCNQARPRGQLPSRALLTSLPTEWWAN